MRVLPALLLALAASASASADPVTVSTDGFPAPVPPLEGPGVADVVVRVDCALADANATVRLELGRLPPWANVTPVPRAVALDCSGGDATEAAFTLAATVSESAPALRPHPFEVRAIVDGADGALVASTDATIEAGYFSVVDAAAVETVKVGAPQSVLVFPIALANHGNGATRVSFEIVDAPAGFSVVPPLPVVLEAAQDGGARTEAVVNVAVMTPYRNGYLNEVGAFTVRAAAAHAFDPTLKGDEAELSFVPSVRGWYVPGPGLVAAALALAAAAAVLRRR